jgi:hypothetical protein
MCGLSSRPSVPGGTEVKAIYLSAL